MGSVFYFHCGCLSYFIPGAVDLVRGCFRPSVTRSQTHYFTFSMSLQSPRLGDCPRCGEEVREADVLIEYDVGKGTEYWCDCRGCGEVVDPDT